MSPNAKAQVRGRTDRTAGFRLGRRTSEADEAQLVLEREKQYAPEEVVTMRRMARLMENGAARLRPWFGDPAPTTDLFR